jgi:hypothetical protein
MTDTKEIVESSEICCLKTWIRSIRLRLHKIQNHLADIDVEGGYYCT